MTQTQAETEKHRVRLSSQDIASGDTLFAQLPSRLQALTDRSLRLQNRILYLDRSIRQPVQAMPQPIRAPSQVALQLEQIRSAFRGG